MSVLMEWKAKISKLPRTLTKLKSYISALNKLQMRGLAKKCVNVVGTENLGANRKYHVFFPNWFTPCLTAHYCSSAVVTFDTISSERRNSEAFIFNGNSLA